MGKKTVREVRVKDIEKRKYPGKHYVYILDVSWSEGTTTVIYRRYSDFFEFQCELLERFPEESGSSDPTSRMIPFLPGKRLFSRTHTRTVAEKRKDKLDEYCRSLIRLPSKISDDQFVIDFFEVWPDDLNPTTSQDTTKTAAEKIQEISEPLVLERFVAMADYEKQKKNECSLEAGQQVEVIDKNENGWWFVNVDDFNEGWVPATFLEPLYGSTEESMSQLLDPGEEEVHIAITSYSPQNDDEIAFEKGVLLEVYEKGLDGWWKVRYQGKEGFAPAAYLQRYRGVAREGAATGAQVVSSVQDAVIYATSNQSAFPAPVTSPKPVEHVPAVISPKPVEHIPAVTSPKPVEHVTSPKPDVSPKPITSPKPEPDNKPKFAPTWHSLAQPYIDKEPIYAPTPRRHSIMRKPMKARLPPVKAKPKRSSPTSTSPPESPSYTGPEYDTPGPVYESIEQPKEQIYVTISDFSASNNGDGLSFTSGVLCSVITKNATGWWYVDMDGVEGWVPSSYLESQSASRPVTPITVSPPPPLPVRNSFVAPSKKEWLSSSDKHISITPMAKKTPPKIERPLPKESKMKNALLISKSSDSLSSRNKPSLRRSQSIDSLDKESPPKPAVKRINSPPTLHVTSSTGWRPKPVTNKPVSAKSNATLSSPRNTEIKKSTTSTSKTLSPRTVRLAKSNISDPVLQKSPRMDRKAPVSKTTSLQGSANKQTANKNSTLHPSGSKSSHSLLLPDNSSARTSSVSRAVKPTPSPSSSGPGVKKSNIDSTGRISADNPRKPAAPRRSSEAPGTSHKRRGSTEDSTVRPSGIKRGSSEDSIVNPPHMSELQGKLRKRTNQPVDNPPKKASPPQRPKARPSNTPSSQTKPSGPPKRPGPPKVSGGKRPPPPRPSASPQVKRNVSYMSVGDYVGGDDSCLSLKEGDWVHVVEKNEDGWWFVEMDGSQGWAPSSFLEEKKTPTKVDNKPSRPSRPKPPPPQRPEMRSVPSIPSRPRPVPPKRFGPADTSENKPPAPVNTDNKDLDTPDAPNNDTAPKPKPRARGRKASTNFVRAVSSYEVPSYEDCGVELRQGRLYEVKERSDSGWWLIKDGDIEGWAPGSHFEAV